MDRENMGPVDKFNSSGTVTSKDGTVIGYRLIGSGPGLIIVHGGISSSQNYLSLAEALADTFTVYIPDRRGRGLSGPAGKDYDIGKECEDLAALLEKTGARRVFGHSSGGLITLEAALRLPIMKIVVYEPAVSIGGSVPTAWYPKFKKDLAKNNPGAAMARVVKGLQLNAKINLIPTWALALLMGHALPRSGEGRDVLKLVGTFPLDMSLVLARESKYEDYRNIKADTVLLGGDESPKYLLYAIEALAKTIPGAKMRILRGKDHSAPYDSPELIAAELKQFLK